MKIKHKKTAEIGSSQMMIFTVNVAFGIDSADPEYDNWAPELIKTVENNVRESFRVIELLKKSKAPPMEECKGKINSLKYFNWSSYIYFSQRLQLYCQSLRIMQAHRHLL